jgi:ubiquitin-hydrolase Zn-finger-containing protein
VKKGLRGINPASKPSGDGCVECLASQKSWWFHLRRCAECGHIGCCDSSPSQHASKHAAATGHPIIASFEPGEEWFYDYEKQGIIKGVAASAAFASKKSARTWTRRKSASQLGIAAALAGVDRFFMNGSGTRDTVFVMSTVSKGVINEHRTNRTEEL